MCHPTAQNLHHLRPRPPGSHPKSPKYPFPCFKKGKELKKCNAIAHYLTCRQLVGPKRHRLVQAHHHFPRAAHSPCRLYSLQPKSLDQRED